MGGNGGDLVSDAGYSAIWASLR